MHFWDSSFESVVRTNLQVIENNSLKSHILFSTRNFIILLHHLPNLHPNNFGELQIIHLPLNDADLLPLKIYRKIQAKVFRV